MRNLFITSSLKNYSVKFDNALLEKNLIGDLGTHFIIDKKVYELYKENFNNINNVILIESNEENKTYQNISNVLGILNEQQLKRDSILVAIGGGVIQDICCFISSIWMRGIKWNFVPTTLLAQCDSCIGAKSSINFGNVKNLLGTFNSPNEIIIDINFLKTLEKKEIDSGIGEIIKLFIINERSLNNINNSYDFLDLIYKSLNIKKFYIESDEFDSGIRNILNYGHCFGHAIESCSNYKIPHGISVSIGIDIVNYFSFINGYITKDIYDYYHSILKSNYIDYIYDNIDFNDIISCVKNDKKNSKKTINLILIYKGSVVKKPFDNTSDFWDMCKICFEEIYNACL